MANSHIGSAFEDFLREDGIADEVDAAAVKRVLAWQIGESLKAQKISKNELAKRMGTSRTQVDRLLDPANARVQLDTLQRAAAALDKRLIVDLV
jgi:DNA-binding Xre family transcriptional regulator